MRRTAECSCCGALSCLLGAAWACAAGNSVSQELSRLSTQGTIAVSTALVQIKVQQQGAPACVALQSAAAVACCPARWVQPGPVPGRWGWPAAVSAWSEAAYMQAVDCIHRRTPPYGRALNCAPTLQRPGVLSLVHRRGVSGMQLAAAARDCTWPLRLSCCCESLACDSVVGVTAACPWEASC